MAAESTAVNAAPTPTGVALWYAKVKDYFEDLKGEMRRVTWPGTKQVQATTAVVIGAVFLFAAYFAVVDAILGRAINQVFQTLARH